jgi:uncharacterized phage-associated protein
MHPVYIKYSEDQISKIGNTIIYLSEKIDNLSKTKLLKLLYILDEVSVRKSGIPFLNLHYDVWKFGPVDKDIFIELSSKPNLLKKFITKTTNRNGKSYIDSIAEFNDDEFSDNEINLLDFVITKFGTKTSTELVSYTHKVGSLWHNVAKKNSILELLETEQINSTELEIDLGELVQHDKRKKQLFKEYNLYY